MKIRRILVSFLIIIMGISLFAACSQDTSPEADEGGSNSDVALLVTDNTDRKIVYTANLYIETEDLTASVKTANDKILLYNGYIESSDISYNTSNGKAYLKIRVKTENFSDFLTSLSQCGTIYSQSSESKDITLQYASVAAELEAYQTELALLLEYAENATEPDKLFYYTQRITEINTKINYYQKQLNSYDSMVEYSTINLTLFYKGERIVIEANYGAKLSNTFIDSLKSLLVVLQTILLIIIAVLPYSLLFALLFFGIRAIIRLLRKKHPKLFVKKPAAPKQNYYTGYHYQPPQMMNSQYVNSNENKDNDIENKN